MLQNTRYIASQNVLRNLAPQFLNPGLYAPAKRYFHTNIFSSQQNPDNQKQQYSTTVQYDPQSVEEHFRFIHSNAMVPEDDTSNKPPAPDELIVKHYLHNHIPLAHKRFRKPGPPYTDTSELEQYNLRRTYQPQGFLDSVALNLMRVLRVAVHTIFGDRYLHHATTLETVASIPGFVASIHRHLKALRSMQRDHGYIGELLEEAENERMHLLVWMKMCEPTFFERMLVVFSQFLFTTFYSAAYLISPKFCHRLVGHLEEEAVNAYTEFLEAIDAGKIKNTPAPDIAKEYWNLSPDATLRDVVLVVRADEALHRDYNHNLATRYEKKMVP